MHMCVSLLICIRSSSNNLITVKMHVSLNVFMCISLVFALLPWTTNPVTLSAHLVCWRHGAGNHIFIDQSTLWVIWSVLCRPPLICLDVFPSTHFRLGRPSSAGQFFLFFNSTLMQFRTQARLCFPRCFPGHVFHIKHELHPKKIF